MKRFTGGALLALAIMPVYAALNTGDAAPDFTAQACLGGHEFTFSLAQTLKKGPVVLYFYPAAYTPGCNLEAHQFAEAADQYRALGAIIIGVSNDKIETLTRFSISECHSRFAVASDTDQKIMKAYDAVLLHKPGHANRTSYVISPKGEIIYSYTDLNPNKHVENTLTALKKWLNERKPADAKP